MTLTDSSRCPGCRGAKHKYSETFVVSGRYLPGEHGEPVFAPTIQGGSTTLTRRTCADCNHVWTVVAG